MKTYLVSFHFVDLDYFQRFLVQWILLLPMLRAISLLDFLFWGWGGGSGSGRMCVNPFIFLFFNVFCFYFLSLSLPNHQGGTTPFLPFYSPETLLKIASSDMRAMCCDICHPTDHQHWFHWPGWLGGCPLPPSPLHVCPSGSCALGRRGWPSLIEMAYSSVKGRQAAVFPC